MDDLLTADDNTIARRMNEEVEVLVGPHLEQYTWILKLLKTRKRRERAVSAQRTLPKEIKPLTLTLSPWGEETSVYYSTVNTRVVLVEPMVLMTSPGHDDNITGYR